MMKKKNKTRVSDTRFQFFMLMEKMGKRSSNFFLLLQILEPWKRPFWANLISKRKKTTPLPFFYFYYKQKSFAAKKVDFASIGLSNAAQLRLWGSWCSLLRFRVIGSIPFYFAFSASYGEKGMWKQVQLPKERRSQRFTRSSRHDEHDVKLLTLLNYCTPLAYH